MIPLWLLSMLHNAAIVAAAVMLALLGYHYVRVARKSR